MYTDRRRQAPLLIFFVLLLAALAIAAPNFFVVSNFTDILINTSFIAIPALGMMCVIVIGQIDVSVGAILAICCTFAGLAAKAGYTPIPVVCGTILVGALLGLLNGALIVGFGIHSIIVTLGTMSVFRGLLVYYTDGAWIDDLPPSFLSIGQGAPFGVPNPIWVMFLVFLIAAGVLRFTVTGRALYAVGSNQSAARLAGLNVPAVQVGAFVTNGRSGRSGGDFLRQPLLQSFRQTPASASNSR
jgi:ribose/xylose/arabinose/galactoside ABC-type transport system permease subunit